jgi:hypothetical protein
MKKLFISHHHLSDKNVDILAEELRLRGVVPWVDHQCGFDLGAPTPFEAQRIIKDECFGLMLYAHKLGGVCPALESSDFIAKIEFPAALTCRTQDASFALFAVPDGLDFEELKRLTISTLGKDLALFDSLAIKKPFKTAAAKVARRALDKVISQELSLSGATRKIQINFNSREYAPSQPGDVLDIDWSKAIGNQRNIPGPTQSRIIAALRDIRQAICSGYGPCTLRIRGRFNLSVALLLGRAFPASSHFKLEIAQNDDFWSTECEPSPTEPFEVAYEYGEVGSDELFVGVTATEKETGQKIRQLITERGSEPFAYLDFIPVGGIRPHAVEDNSVCCAMARQVRIEVAKILNKHSIRKIHFFTAVPQALAVMIGHNMNATCPIQTYEIDDNNYLNSFELNERDL